MRVLVLGATGRVGRLVVEQALERGHQVTALVRDPRKLGALAARLRVVPGDALDRDSVGRAVGGQDAVVYALGAGAVRTTTLFSESTAILLDAMQRHGTRRLIAITGIGAGETKGHGGFLYDRILYPLFTHGLYEDKDRQERLIRESALNWTIVRPAPFRKTAPDEPLHVEIDVDGVTLRRIAPGEVAAFVVEQLESSRYLKKAPFIGHP